MEATLKPGYRLYGWKLTGSLAIEAALAEAGAEFEFIPISRNTDENLGEDYRRINPRQQLPAVGLPDGSYVAEGPAILLHIADAFPGAGLAPKPGVMREPTMTVGWLFSRQMSTRVNSGNYFRPAMSPMVCAPGVSKRQPKFMSSATT
jgi:glutathione S-transferase